jgi:hypothetical protein
MHEMVNMIRNQSWTIFTFFLLKLVMWLLWSFHLFAGGSCKEILGSRFLWWCLGWISKWSRWKYMFFLSKSCTYYLVYTSFVVWFILFIIVYIFCKRCGLCVDCVIQILFSLWVLSHALQTYLLYLSIFQGIPVLYLSLLWHSLV